MNQQVKIICDNCKQEVSPTRQHKKLRKGFFQVLLVCPSCGFSVHSHYSSDELEKAERILANFKLHSTRSLKDKQRYHLKIAEYKRQHQRLQDKVARMMVRV